jgi:pSer/pThr/pTyr-binding forkhead associated (FHA) protein
MSIPSIQVLFNGEIVQTIPFHKETLSIGRMRENDIVIDNLAVSRFHAKLTLSNGQIVLEDQESENGCFVNGKRISKQVITPQDEVVIGKHQLLVSTSLLDVTPSLSFRTLFEEESAKQPPVSNAWDVSSTYMVD